MTDFSPILRLEYLEMRDILQKKINALHAEVAAARVEAGQLRIVADYERTLRESCETALAARDTEIASLRELVKKSYDEGWEDHDSEISRDVLWDASTTRAALEAKPCTEK